ncbi:hypothetical protein BN2537_16807 [Streptomyces venezuelae]|nr:hypothetical protein BN2537_16807 [Streptomyces venezuelae]
MRLDVLLWSVSRHDRRHHRERGFVHENRSRERSQWMLGYRRAA